MKFKTFVSSRADPERLPQRYSPGLLLKFQLLNRLMGRFFDGHALCFSLTWWQ